MNSYTEIFEVKDLAFPRIMFSFKPFPEISQMRQYDQTAFFGRVLKQSKYRLIEIEISDEQHNKIFCTIWEANVDSYISDFKKSQGTIPIVIVQIYKPNLFRGEMRISIHFQASKVLINPKLDEVTDFRKRYKLLVLFIILFVTDFGLYFYRIEGDERFICNGSLGPVGPNISSEFENLTVKSLEDLECLEDGLYWVFGNIISVEAHYDTWYYLSCKTCFKKVELEDNKFECSLCKSTYSHAYRRYKFIVNIVDDTSNTSLLVWDREGIQLIGKKVYEFVGADNQVLPMEDIAKEIEKKLVGQSVLFKLQFRNQQEYHKSYPHTVNKVCNIPHVVEKYTPQKFGSQEVKKEIKLSDLIFGSDLPEVYEKSIVTPDLSSVTNEINHEFNIEGSVKRSLEADFNCCDDIVGFQENKKPKVNKEY
ncbi:replication protein A 70 kDa DNA-binding subunit B-like [Salvia splendens]|uniref:replication protein A 70 kDa DNA-binding subunit B-like n=1 Tax=Salvia splendens TaxID=180675 RepID=UPI001C264736|nr:replication protein A 70 kDa DNA-binding subunit B-like [Salvia splendens]